MTNDERNDVSAQLRHQEYLIQQLFANMFIRATEPRSSWERFGGQLIDAAARMPSVPSGEGDEWIEDQQRRSKELMKAFVSKVAEQIARAEPFSSPLFRQH